MVASIPDRASRLARRILLPTSLLLLVVTSRPAGDALGGEFAEPGPQGFSLSEGYGEEAGRDTWFSDGRRGTVPGQGLGWVGDIGHQTGPDVGREDSITTFEAMPYFSLDPGMVFADLRFIVSNEGQFGGSAGLGYRHYVKPWDRIFGVSGWYDRDNLPGDTFHQWGLTLESYGQWWDFIANYYRPIDDTPQLLDINFVPGSQEFRDFRVFFDLARLFGLPMRGFDMELGLPIQGDFFRRHQVTLWGGWHRFEHDQAETANGWRTRISAEVVPSLDMHLLVTDDDVFHTNVVFGVHWTFTDLMQGRTGGKRTVQQRMTQRVRRNYNVVVARQTVIDPDQIAVNPADGLPYLIVHVDSNAAPGGNGTFENPFRTIQQGQAFTPPPDIVDITGDPRFAEATGDDVDIIFVHANSVFDNTLVVLDTRQRILGEGRIDSGRLDANPNAPTVQHLINVTALPFPMPLPNSRDVQPGDVFNRPELRNSPGDAVTLASNSEFSGFRILNPFGLGMVGRDLSNSAGLLPGPDQLVSKNTDIEINDVIGPAQGGVLIETSTGPINFQDMFIVIDDAQNDNTVTPQPAFHVVGGNARIRYISTFDTRISAFPQGQIINIGNQPDIGNALPNNFALLVENTTGGIVDFAVEGAGAAITDIVGQGVRIVNSAGDVRVDNLIVAHSSGTGISIEGGTGRFTFFDSIDAGGPGPNGIIIDNPQGIAVNIIGLEGTGRVAFRDDVRINPVQLGNFELMGGRTAPIVNLRQSAFLNFRPVDIGVSVADTAGSVLFRNVFIETPTRFAGTSPLISDAILFTSSTGLLTFEQIEINRATTGLRANGIHIENTVGSTDPAVPTDPAVFTVAGTTFIANTGGGVIGGGAGILIRDDFTQVTFHSDRIRQGALGTAQTEIAGRDSEGILIERAHGDIRFTGTTLIGTGSAATGLAIREYDPDTSFALGVIRFGTVNIDAAFGPTPLPPPGPVLPPDPTRVGSGVDLRNNAGRIEVGTLNVDVLNGIGLFGFDSTFTIANGRLTATGAAATPAPAIYVTDSFVSMAFESVSANGGDNGIRMERTVLASGGGIFTLHVRGTGLLPGLPGAPGSGGVISGMNVIGDFVDVNGALLSRLGAGAYFEDAGAVRLENMIIDGNIVGIRAVNTLDADYSAPVFTPPTTDPSQEDLEDDPARDDFTMDEITVVNSQITDSLDIGFDGMNMNVVGLTNNTFTDNLGESVRLLVNRPVVRDGVGVPLDLSTYQYVIANNIFTDTTYLFAGVSDNIPSTPHIIHIQNLATANGAHLAGLTITQNVFNQIVAGTQQVFLTVLDGSTAINVDWTGLITGALIAENDISVVSPTSLLVNPVGNTGIRFVADSFVDFKSILIADNVMEVGQDRSTGIDIEINGPAELGISGNIIDLIPSPLGLVGLRTGIQIFSSTPTILLFGDDDNIVTGALVPFLATPLPNFTGTILVNGAPVP